MAPQALKERKEIKEIKGKKAMQEQMVLMGQQALREIKEMQVRKAFRV